MEVGINQQSHDGGVNVGKDDFDDGVDLRHGRDEIENAVLLTRPMAIGLERNLATYAATVIFGGCAPTMRHR